MDFMVVLANSIFPITEPRKAAKIPTTNNK
jgi:hypothetical protein